MGSLMAGGILAIVTVIASIAFYVLLIVASVRIYRTINEMSQSRVSAVRAAGESSRGIAIAAIVCAAVPFGITGIVALVFDFILAHKTKPELYPQTPKNTLSPEQVAAMSPIERARARREGLIGTRPVHINDMTKDGCFRASVIAFIAEIVLGLIMVFTLSAGAGGLIGNFIGGVQDGNLTLGDDSIQFKDGTWSDESGSIIMEYPDDIDLGTGDGLNPTQ